VKSIRNDSTLQTKQFYNDYLRCTTNELSNIRTNMSYECMWMDDNANTADS